MTGLGLGLYLVLMTVFSAGYRDYFGGSTPFGVIAPAFPAAPIIVSTLVEGSPSGSG
jgi:hypothetical protein